MYSAQGVIDVYSLNQAEHKVFIGQATPTLLFLFVKIRRNKRASFARAASGSHLQWDSQEFIPALNLILFDTRAQL